MGSWAHREAKALLQLKVETGNLTAAAESRVRGHLQAGETRLALETLVSGSDTEPLRSD